MSKTIGRPTLPKGKKKVLQAFKLRPEHIKYLEIKAETDSYDSKSHVVDSAIELFMSLEP